jgi:hypothetical protein
MDPYVEASGLWEDFHLLLIPRIHEQLARAAPPGYLVRGAKREYVVLVEPEGKTTRHFLPDVNIAAPRAQKKSPRRKGAGAAEPAPGDAPVTMCAFVEEDHREAFVEIRESAPGHDLVTVIEVLSPANKRTGVGRDLYLRKRQSLMVEGVNLVEIDLLRGGEKMPMRDEYPKWPYTLLVARSKKVDLCQVWPGHFRKPLPPIPVPLRKPDADLTLSLQPMIDTVYQLSSYGETIDYTKSLSPALDGEDAAWLRERLPARKS